MTDGQAPAGQTRALEWLALVAILISAFSLRIYDVNWDEGHFLHPDELHVTNVAYGRIHFDGLPTWQQLTDPETSPFNPRQSTCDGQPCNFAYGALPLLITDFIAESLADLTGDPYDQFDEIPRVGRSISAIVDTITVLLVFLIASRLFGGRAGLLAAAIYAATPLAIQLSHFFTTDIWLALFVSLTIWASLLALERESMRWFAFAGASFGWALATKGSVLLLAGVVALAAIFVASRHLDPADPGAAMVAAVKRLLVSGVVALLAFAMFEPYALLRLGIYMDQLQEQQLMSSGEIDFPYTRRYVGTTPVLYQLEQLVRWGMGPVAAIVGIAGVCLLIYWAIRHRRSDIALLLSFLALQGVVILLPEIKYLRYQIPVVPLLAVAGGAAIAAGAGWLARRWNRALAGAFLTICLAGIGLWTAAFVSIYEGDHPRVAASKWIYANAPAGSTISAESWDDALPVNFGPGLTFGDQQYQRTEFDIYGDRPPDEVMSYLYEQLQSTDYVVISSNRLLESVQQLPWRYPVQIRFYELLESGELGFTRAAKFQTVPEVGPLEFDDSLADESWINYDHPTVLIYQKTDLVDRAAYGALMNEALDSAWSPQRQDPATSRSLMLDVPVSELPVVDDARWSERWTSDSLVALLFWVALLAVLYVAGSGWARLLFPRFPDGGAGLARVVSLVLGGWIVWYLASLELIQFRAIWSWVSLGVVAISGNLLLRLVGSRDRQYHRTVITGAEIAFWSVFALFLLFRWINPDSWHPIWGGEKPMEFAHLNATLRSAHFPPYDPWYAGGYINYYYYGLYLVAWCIKLTGIPAEIAFNLAQPTIMGMMASAGYSVAAALGSTRRLVGRSVATGLCAALLIVLIGNLASFFTLLKAWPDEIQPDFGRWTWEPSRAIASTITEFPYFTGLYADLHAHGINVPITLMVLGLFISLVRDPHMTRLVLERRRPDRTAIGLGVRLIATGIGVGSVATTNSWDAAEYVLFTAVALFMTTLTIRPLLTRLVATAGLGLAVGGVALIAFLPFYLKYVALFSEIGRTRDRTDVTQFTMHLGGLLAIVGVGASALLLGRLRGRPSWLVIDPILPLSLVVVASVAAAVTNFDANRNDSSLKLALIVALVVLVLPVASVVRDALPIWTSDVGPAVAIAGLVAVEAGLVIVGHGVLAIALAFFMVGGALWLFADDRGERFTGAMIACAAGVFGAIEVFFLQDNLAGGPNYRMNTVFKFYNQVWVLLAVAGAVVLGRALDGSGLLGWFGRPQRIGFAAIPSRYTGNSAAPPLADEDEVDDLDDEDALDDLDDEFDGDDSLDLDDDLDDATDDDLDDLFALDHTNGERDYFRDWDGDDWEGEAQPILNDNSLMRLRWFRATVVVGILVVAMSLVYPILGTKPRLDQRFVGNPGITGLNGYDWMEYATLTNHNGETIGFAGDRDAIYWFLNDVAGTPVLMEAHIGPYRGNGSRFSINTGLPAVIGWANHETQQRYISGIDERVRAVDEFYDTTDLQRKLEILTEYGVEYVIVGDVERLTTFEVLEDGEQVVRYWADPAGIAAIESMVGTYLEPAFESGSTVVYRVIAGEQTGDEPASSR